MQIVRKVECSNGNLHLGEVNVKKKSFNVKISIHWQKVYVCIFLTKCFPFFFLCLKIHADKHPKTYRHK